MPDTINIAAGPTVSIVTISFNSSADLEKTVASVLSQGYKQKEFLVIDGGSTDGSLAVIKKNDSQIDFWCSEPDRGIYDAMNKGIQHANGQWLIFMNAGDIFYSTETLKNIFEENSINAFDIIYGKHVTSYGEYSFVNTQLAPLHTIWKKMPFSHQAVFCKTEWLKARGFDTNYKVVADHDMMYEYYLKGAKFYFLDEVIAVASLGGISDTQRIQSYRERLSFIRKYSASSFKMLYLRSILIKEYIFLYIKQFLGPSIVARIIKARNSVFRDIES